MRRVQLEARGRKLGLKLPTFLAKTSVTRASVRQALVDSGKALETFFLAHDAHPRGSILLTLEQCGHVAGQDVRYGLWDGDRQ